MIDHPALSIRSALEALRRVAPGSCHVHGEALAPTAVAARYAAQYAGVPATGRDRTEDVVLHERVGAEGQAPVLLGLYGDPARLWDWLPGLSEALTPEGVRQRLAAGPEPVFQDEGACLDRVWDKVDLGALPVLTTTPRDAGPYLTMGLVHAHDPEGGEDAWSMHRMLVVGSDKLTIWMLPGRRLRTLYEAAMARGEDLAVTVNIGPPPAMAIASSLGTAHLPEGISKIKAAGALAGRPLALTQLPGHGCPALAGAEIVLHGHLTAELADEGPGGLGNSMPEFLGYDGAAKAGLPVLKVSTITTRFEPIYQAVIGPGREQSTILGLAGALSVALSLAATAPELAAAVENIRFPTGGGGMLFLAITLNKTAPEHDQLPAALAEILFARHGFVKVILFVDGDVNLDNADDLLWAMTTRANLRGDCVGLTGHPNLRMDPSQGDDWLRLRGLEGEGAGRAYIDATVPFALKGGVTRGFPWPLEAASHG